MTRATHCHKLIAQVAKEQTGILYETVMSNNQVRAAWKARYPDMNENELVGKFISKYWPRAIDAARATLSTMLTGPYSEEVKNDIHEALCLDWTLVRGRKNPMTILKQRT